jgi:hypothetical protein
VLVEPGLPGIEVGYVMAYEDGAHGSSSSVTAMSRCYDLHQSA